MTKRNEKKLMLSVDQSGHWVISNFVMGFMKKLKMVWQLAGNFIGGLPKMD